MRSPNPHYKKLVREVFLKASFIQNLGIKLVRVTPGTCEASLLIRKNHLQQNGFVHAGVVTTLADHTAGSAACSMMEPHIYGLTAEFKINLLRPAKGPRLTCKAVVLKAGRVLTICESSVYGLDKGRKILVAKGLFTQVVVPGSGRNSSA